jgi:hypothetical protein
MGRFVVTKKILKQNEKAADQSGGHKMARRACMDWGRRPPTLFFSEERKSFSFVKLLLDLRNHFCG